MSTRLHTHRSLNVIALISGGKDSFLSLLHCLSLGHDVVAFANLSPPDVTDVSSDLNSHMYQTAGHALVNLYHQALSIPLYRSSIKGTTVDQGKEYSAQRTSEGPSDETEDLIPLLQKVLEAHPTADALSTGAILSTYQRTRVESVCLRLGLTSLAFLWQYPYLPFPQPSPSSELEHIAAVGLDARIVKVASGGLDDSFLWQSLADAKVRRRVEKAVGRFGGSVLGEGGEYETIVVSGPVPPWIQALNINTNDLYVQKGEGGEAYLTFKENPKNSTFHHVQAVEYSKGTTGNSVAWLQKLRRPDLWDEEFKTCLRDHPQLELSSPAIDAQYEATCYATRHVTDNGSNIAISNLTSHYSKIRVEEQMESIMRDLENILHTRGRSIDDLIFTTIILRSMTDFTELNQAYGKFFTRPCPPARVTVACGDMMPNGASVMFSAIASKKPRERRRGLHVQSRSYWAPANIGPYSQAISTECGEDGSKSIIYVAGQIPLVPATMELLDSETDESLGSAFSKQALLSLQHLWRIGIEMGVTWWPGAIAFITTSEGTTQKAQICHSLWESMTSIKGEENGSIGPGNDNEEDSDIWDRTYGNDRSYAVADDSRRPLPDFTSMKRCDKPGFLAVEVAELPRGSQVEWQSVGFKGEGLESVSCNTYQEGDPTTPSVNGEEISGQLITKCSLDSKSSMVFLELPVLPDELSLSSLLEIKDLSELTAFTGTVYTTQPELFGDVPVQVVPCRTVWRSGGRRLEAGLVVILGT